ncbi:MAG: helix-turn-helix domain-containing protein [Candidatus Altiarchaeota archaeon]|nr:helix-turn-helix domain-containing protein [Candidatus Altiarchaeota archaeon]
MKLPCEDALWYTLPKIRADLAKELVSKGLSQKDVAEKLGVTPSAISQYLHKKRGDSSAAPEGYGKMITEAATDILESSDESKVMGLVCRCCALSRKD